jgi:methylthioribose-1-phosphate isomerase
MQAHNEKSVVLIQGLVDESLFDLLKNNAGETIFLLEGRPKLKAVKILSKQLNARKIIPTLIADNMAGFLFYKNLVKEVWLGAQSTEKDGALCNTGALILGVLAKRHGVPVYAYPMVGKNKAMANAKDIFSFNGVRVAPKGIKGYVPLNEWVPAKYISKVYGKN